MSSVIKPMTQETWHTPSFERVQLPEQVCPNCHSQGLLGFYEVGNVPVHSCLLMSSRDEALQYRRGDLQLGFCPSCGFIANARFDPVMEEYSTRYEETQGFSECFNTFACGLARRLADQYGIRRKNILEIGCGKGEFLGLLCQLGDNQGIGIDPAYVPKRRPEGAESRVVFIQDLYSEKYAHLQADAIICRHTLEHIAPTRRFLQMLRSSIGDRLETLVFFELPDTMRILREGAFWDLYYEHCSYFTAGSLARLFRSAGFDLIDLQLDYDDQYLLLLAKPVPGVTAMRLDLEDDLDDLAFAVGDFQRVCRAEIECWHSRIQRMAATGRRVVVWGSGSKGVAFLSTLGVTDAIEYVVDINPHRHGKFMPGTGQQIVPPLFLAEYRPDYVIVMNPIYCDEIQRNLDRVGCKTEVLPV